MIKYNRNHFKKVHQTKVYQDLIYRKIEEDDMWDKILRGDLLSEEYKSNEVYQFLSLLQTKDGEVTRNYFELINEKE